jgi:choline dehydrogenase-like flavoprotein
MVVSLNERADGATITCDVAVIGAGAAGQTVAKALADMGRSVLMIESGGLDYDSEIQELNRAGQSGTPYYDLFRARLRFFGGTTAIWGGRTCRLDPIDYAKRDWVPHSGWPFSEAELTPYYEMAEARLGLRSDYRGVHVLDRMHKTPRFDRAQIDASYWQFDHHIDRFTAPYRDDVTRHPRIEVLVNATVTEIVAAADGKAIERLDLANLSGRKATVTAKQYVLACGGIENARLLLASRSVMPTGLGNDRDWVGRTFMEHVHCRGGEFVTDHPVRMLSFGASFRMKGSRYAAALRPGEALQRDRHILNGSLTVNARRPPGRKLGAFISGFNYMRHSMAAPNKFWRKSWYALKHSGTRFQEWADPYRPALLTKVSERGIYAIFRSEQAPNRDSRITLNLAETDPLGMPRANLHWALSEIDKRTIGVTMEALDGEMQRLGLGRARKMPWLDDTSVPWEFDPLISKNPIGGYHHMGTTRMHDSPSEGVCDAHGRVHGLANLHVAGSSLFPTGGWANPTLTILALAFRLADRLAKTD